MYINSALLLLFLNFSEIEKKLERNLLNPNLLQYGLNNCFSYDKNQKKIRHKQKI